MELLPSWEQFKEFILHNTATNEFFSAALFFSTLGLLATYGKKFAVYLWRRIRRKLVFSVHVYQTDPFYEKLENWIRYQYRGNYRNVEAKTQFDDVDNEEGIEYAQYEDSFIIWNGIIPIRVYKGREKLENASSLKQAYLNRFNLSGVFAKRSINSIFKKVEEYNEEVKSKELQENVRVYSNSYDHWNRIMDVQPKKIGDVIIEGKEELMNDMNNFLNNKKWYDDRGIVHKRGYLFYGKPGNGKTSLCLSLAKYYGRRIYMFGANEDVSDHNLVQLFSNMMPNSILVIEDIDAMFNKNRDKEKASHGFNFSTLLNCIDGAFSKTGTICIFSTNHPERLDDALKRQGRMDFTFEIKNPNVDSITEYFEKFYDQEIDLGIDKNFDNKYLPMVGVQDVCIRNIGNVQNAIKVVKEKLNEELFG